MWRQRGWSYSVHWQVDLPWVVWSSPSVAGMTCKTTNLSWSSRLFVRLWPRRGVWHLLVDCALTVPLVRAQPGGPQPSGPARTHGVSRGCDFPARYHLSPAELEPRTATGVLSAAARCPWLELRSVRIPRASVWSSRTAHSVSTAASTASRRDRRSSCAAIVSIRPVADRGQPREVKDLDLSGVRTVALRLRPAASRRSPARRASCASPRA